MLALHASNVLLATIVETLILENMLLICVLRRYYGVHRAFCFMENPANLKWWFTISIYYYHIH